MTDLPQRPLTVLIAALGGEGGGVLADWLVDTATEAGFPVQSTSIPGVAQRTGATTYYIEIFPAPVTALSGREPVLALTPNPGNIDIMVASELVEAGRALQNGFVSDRTTLIASTHRIYATVEKMAMGDGRYDSGRIRVAAEALSRRAILFDFARIAQETGSVINAVLFGALAGAGVLPFSRAACEDAIRRAGKGAEGSLRGFAVGFACGAGEASPDAEAKAPGSAARPVDAVRRAWPPQTHRMVEEGIARLVDFQDEAYARLYLDRLEPILALDRRNGHGDFRLTAETARHLALWMSYEDVIRVADLKTRPERLARVRSEVSAQPGEPVAIIEYLKPGLDEFCAIMPPKLARRVQYAARAWGVENRLNVGLHVKTTSILGFLLLRALAGLRRWRRSTWRFAEESARIERWLGVIGRHAERDVDVALEVAECARLVKGYGETHRRGLANFERIVTALAERPWPDPRAQAEALRGARLAALADPDGTRLTQALAVFDPAAARSAAE